MGLQTAEESQDIDQPAPTVPFTSNGGRAAQVKALLSGDVETLETGEQAVSPFAPQETEDAASYVKRLRAEIDRSASEESLNEIVSAAGSYAGGEILSEEDFGKLTDQANKRMGEILKAKSSGKLA
jgi:hypothetical protein